MLTSLRLISVCLVVVSFLGCKTRTYHADAGKFLIAQETLPAPDTGGLYMEPAGPLSYSAVERKAAPGKTSALRLTKKKLVESIKVIRPLKKKVEILRTNPVTAIKSLKKKSDFRIVDVLFFVIIALLLTVALVLLKQFGLSNDAVIFIAMGIAIVIAVVYIYLRTWIFTA